jgi:hypothetical protein
MPTHTIHFAGGLNGPQTLVGLDVGTIHAPRGGPPGTWNALIDTGSTSTAIRSALLPRSIGKARVSRPVLGIVWEETYFIGITIERRRATGAHAFSSLEREDMRRRGITDAFLRPILPGLLAHAD